MPPRIRTIKPEFASDAKLGSVSRDARLTFVLLITQADDHGLVLGNARQLLGSLYPHDDSVDAAMLKIWISELVGIDAVRRRFTREESEVVELVNWKKHQKVDHPGRPVIQDLLKPIEALATPSLEARGEFASSSRPDPVPTTSTSTSAEAIVTSPSADRTPSWLLPAAAAWEAKHGDRTFPWGRAGRALKPLHDAANDPETIGQRLAFYIRRTPVEYRSFEKFAATFAEWDGDAPGLSPEDGAVYEEAAP